MVLLLCGAKASARTNNGGLAAEEAIKRNRNAIFEILLSYPTADFDASLRIQYLSLKYRKVVNESSDPAAIENA